MTVTTDTPQCPRSCLTFARELGETNHQGTELEWWVGTLADVRDIAYPPFSATCPHGVTFTARPTLTQIAKWEAVGAA